MWLSRGRKTQHTHCIVMYTNGTLCIYLHKVCWRAQISNNTWTRVSCAYFFWKIEQTESGHNWRPLKWTVVVLLAKHLNSKKVHTKADTQRLDCNAALSFSKQQHSAASNHFEHWAQETETACHSLTLVGCAFLQPVDDCLIDVMNAMARARACGIFITTQFTRCLLINPILTGCGLDSYDSSTTTKNWQFTPFGLFFVVLCALFFEC